MQRFRELIASTASPSDYDRPGSLYAAGAVGERLPAVARREARLAATDSDIGPARTERGERARPTPGDRPGRPTRSTAEPPPERERDARADLMAALRSPSALRTAVLLREVLDAPVALRDDPRQR
ncbi:MAG: hypothetical protein AVDCRST_MAG33-1315 [uncultured Thermomicrobiales bacterium]|uniref:Uncharacterized protein n=1 Tax=uncultured Thermomicrobiales bacterium TaxID=1645740 RepID=A0A6J4US34_9BACT|nr:MAG: hypothetical protein AVDCRST_MAG33-1315 [uncultured Thermomicrobiales bacterium]